MCIFLLTCAKSYCISTPVVSDLFSKKCHPSIKLQNRYPQNGKEKSLSNVDKRLADSRRGPCTRSSFKNPQVSYVCLLSLTCMFYFLTLPWLARQSWRLGHDVGHDSLAHVSCFIHILPGASDNLPGASAENSPTSLIEGGTEAQRDGAALSCHRLCW